MRRMIGFITVSYTCTLSYNEVQAVPALFTQLQFAVADALGFPLFSLSRLRATAFNTL
jgi:hypothetical protein